MKAFLASFILFIQLLITSSVCRLVVFVSVSKRKTLRQFYHSVHISMELLLLELKITVLILAWSATNKGKFLHLMEHSTFIVICRMQECKVWE